MRVEWAVAQRERTLATYLYGVVRRQEQHRKWGTGVGHPAAPLRLVAHGNIAGLVSDAAAQEWENEGRALRRDLRAHEEVVRRAGELGTVLPVSLERSSTATGT